MRVDLSGRVALVTGAARGIGRAIAAVLAANGASVVWTDLDGAALREAAGDGVALNLDVTKPDQIAAVRDAVIERFGRLDILVNNAGIGTGPAERAPIHEVDPAQWARVLDVDLNGVFAMCRAFAGPMVAQGSGRIVNITSVVGLVPLRLQSAYVAAEAGVVNLTRSMALELGPHGVLVNAIAPGATVTETWRGWIGDAASEQQSVYARLLSHVPLGRAARPEEIANAALFLAAPASSYVTGHVLTVDGGWTAGYSRDF